MSNRMLLLVAMALVPAGGRVARAEEVLLEDSLQGASKGQIYHYGPGSPFSAEGFKPCEGHLYFKSEFVRVLQQYAHILYDLPVTVLEGRLEFEMKGVSAEGVKPDDDGAFVAMYDGRGITEPIRYSPDFRENFFRWNVHWRNNRSAIKAVLNLATPNAERQNAEVAIFTDARDYLTEPTGSGMSWDVNKWYKLVVEWKARGHRVTIDGKEVWKVNGVPYDYAPVNHRISLGGGPGKYACSMPGLTIRNFKLTAYKTAKLRKDPVLPVDNSKPTTPATPDPMDAAEPTASNDGGAPAGGAGASPPVNEPNEPPPPDDGPDESAGGSAGGAARGGAGGASDGDDDEGGAPAKSGAATGCAVAAAPASGAWWLLCCLPWLVMRARR